MLAVDGDVDESVVASKSSDGEEEQEWPAKRGLDIDDDEKQSHVTNLPVVVASQSVS